MITIHWWPAINNKVWCLYRKNYITQVLPIGPILIWHVVTWVLLLTHFNLPTMNASSDTSQLHFGILAHTWGNCRQLMPCHSNEHVLHLLIICEYLFYWYNTVCIKWLSNSGLRYSIKIDKLVVTFRSERVSCSHKTRNMIEHQRRWIVSSTFLFSKFRQLNW